MTTTFLTTTPDHAATTAATIARLFAMRLSAYNDLAAGVKRLQDSEWARDRMNDIMYANRELKRLGVIPETCGTDE